jgi:hypothetical protein
MEQERSLGPALALLEQGLVRALAYYADNERNGAMMALDTFLEFVAAAPGWQQRDLGLPIFSLLTALMDLDYGRVGPLFSPNPAVRNRPPDAGMRKIVKAYAVCCVEVACRAGLSVTESCRIVAQALQEKGFTLGGRAESSPWKIVKGWRDRVSKLPRDDQMRQTLDGLRPVLAPVELTEEQARGFPKAQLSEILGKLGPATLE